MQFVVYRRRMCVHPKNKVGLRETAVEILAVTTEKTVTLNIITSWASLEMDLNSRSNNSSTQTGWTVIHISQ